MSQHTFTPGTRVRVFPGGTFGTVANIPEISAEFAGFTPVIFDGRTKAVPCSTENMIAFVPASPFSPGARVADQGNGRLGTVADDPIMRAEHPGMIAVHWDNGWRSVAAPSILEPAPAGFHAYTDTALEAEASQHATDTAVAVLRARPELTTKETTVNALIRAALAAGLLPSVLLEAYGIVTAGATK